MVQQQFAEIVVSRWSSTWWVTDRRTGHCPSDRPTYQPVSWSMMDRRIERFNSDQTGRIRFFPRKTKTEELKLLL